MWDRDGERNAVESKALGLLLGAGGAAERGDRIRSEEMELRGEVGTCGGVQGGELGRNAGEGYPRCSSFDPRCSSFEELPGRVAFGVVGGVNVLSRLGLGRGLGAGSLLPSMAGFWAVVGFREASGSIGAAVGGAAIAFRDFDLEGGLGRSFDLGGSGGQSSVSLSMGKLPGIARGGSGGGVKVGTWRVSLGELPGMGLLRSKGRCPVRLGGMGSSPIGVLSIGLLLRGRGKLPSMVLDS